MHNTLGSFDENRYEDIPIKKRRSFGKAIAAISTAAVRKHTGNRLRDKLNLWKKFHLGKSNRRVGG